MAKQQPRRCDRGGVITEISLVIPLLVIFFGGFVQLGMYVSQVALAGQTAYQAALLGGKTNKSYRHGAMIARADELNAVLVKRLDGVNYSPQSDNETRNVSFQYTSKVQSLIPGYDIPLNLNIVGPVLVNDTDVVGDFSDFANGSCLFNTDYTKYCDGSRPVESGPVRDDPVDFRRSAPEFDYEPDRLAGKDERNYTYNRTGREGGRTGGGGTGTGTGGGR